MIARDSVVASIKQARGDLIEAGIPDSVPMRTTCRALVVIAGGLRRDIAGAIGASRPRQDAPGGAGAGADVRLHASFADFKLDGGKGAVPTWRRRRATQKGRCPHITIS